MEISPQVVASGILDEGLYRCPQDSRPSLSTKTMKRLRHVRKTDTAAWKRVVENQGLVYSVIDKKFNWLFHSDKAETMMRDDYIQEGLIGLLTAAKKYDPRRGEFSTYAWPWIYQAISRAHRAKHFRSTRVAYGVYEVISRIKKDHPEDFEQRILNGQRRNIIQGFNALTKSVSLNEETEDGCSIGALLPAANGNGGFHRSIDQQYLLDMIQKASEILTIREKRVLFLKFGIGCEEARTMEISKRLRITRKAAEYAERRALVKIRDYFKQNNWTIKTLNPF